MRYNLNVGRKMEVCRGNAPRSQLYESRASLTTLADLKVVSVEGFAPPTPDGRSF